MVLPVTLEELLKADWSHFDAFAKELAERPLTAENVEEWLDDWSQMAFRVTELYNRLLVATTRNTVDKAAEEQFNHFMDQIYPKAAEAEQLLKEKLLSSGFEPSGFEIPLRNFRAEADLFRKENLQLLAEEQKLANEYDKIAGAQTVEWEGQTLTVSQLQPLLQSNDREKREKVWRISFERVLQDRQKINDLWNKLLEVRLKIADNAGRPDYRAYRWQQLLRFDYTPQDCLSFHQAIEEVVVPVTRRIYERRRQQLGVDVLRPWDLDVDPLGRDPLRPYQQIDELRNGIAAIFNQVDPQFGEYYATLVREELLDLDNRPNKAPGAYSTDLQFSKRPFVFCNSVGIHDDVQTLLHECGHAFHTFEVTPMRWSQQWLVGNEFCEVASMGMELLGSAYLTRDKGGFYTPQDAARALIEHLEKSICFWPYMAVVDAFQHWVYENPQQASDSAACDASWANLWERFMPGVDWSGLEAIRDTGWHRKLHIHTYPFYYIEYGLALLGAVQVWRNSLHDRKGAVAAYRRALALGGTAALPALYQTAGARLAFDAATLGEAVELMEKTILEQEKITGA
jgi:oligoendopeptidase F